LRVCRLRRVPLLPQLHLPPLHRRLARRFRRLHNLQFRERLPRKLHRGSPLRQVPLRTDRVDRFRRWHVRFRQFLQGLGPHVRVRF
jgi:hypothetical protein